MWCASQWVADTYDRDPGLVGVPTSQFQQGTPRVLTHARRRS
jgi:hypothetical protein